METENTKIKIGKQIKARREFLDISQNDLSMHSGVAQTRLSQIELGKTNFTIDTIEIIADVLGMEVRLVEKGNS